MEDSETSRCKLSKIYRDIPYMIVIKFMSADLFDCLVGCVENQKVNFLIIIVQDIENISLKFQGHPTTLRGGISYFGSNRPFVTPQKMLCL